MYILVVAFMVTNMRKILGSEFSWPSASSVIKLNQEDIDSKY